MQYTEPLLLPTDKCSWAETDVPLGRRGVSVEWLYDFVAAPRLGVDHEWKQWESAQQAYERDCIPTLPPQPEHPRPWWTSRYFIEKFVLPATHALEAPLYARVPEEHRGEPTLFVSHSWDSCPLEGAHGSLDMVKVRSPEAFVWIDFVCYNQHIVSNTSIAPDMQAVVSDIGSVAFPWTSAPFFTRSWCLWELVCAHLSKAQIGVYDQMQRISKKYWSSEAAMRPPKFTSVADLSATEQADQERILELMISTFGSVEEADEFVRGILPEWV